METIITDVTLLGGDAASMRTVNLRIDGTRISAIGDQLLSAEPGATLIDGGGKLALPGLVNAHTHLPMVLFRGLGDNLPLREWLEEVIWTRESRLTPQDVYWGSLLGLAAMVRSGTTALADMYFHVDAIGTAVEEAGLRATLSYGIIAQDLDAHGREELARAETVVECWEGRNDGRIRTAISPHAPYTVGETVWREAIGLARHHGVLLHTHLAETREEVRAWRSRIGESPVVSLDRMGAFGGRTLAAHCVHVDADDIALLAERGVCVAHCPKSNAKLGSGVAPVQALRRAGVRVALGTDGAASNDGLDLIEEMRFAALLQKATAEDPAALSAGEVLEMATSAGAAALGLNAGELTVGCEADLILVDLDRVETLPHPSDAVSLVYAAGGASVRDVIVAGEVLLRDGELLTIDEEKVKEEVKRLAGRYRN